jgi:hypothetical protein
MKTANKFAIAAALGLMTAGAAWAQQAPALAPDEQATLKQRDSLMACQRDQEANNLKVMAEYNRELERRQTYINDRAQDIARQRNEAGMHVVIGSALSEGMTDEQATAFVESLIQSDQRTIAQELQRVIEMPQQPPTTRERCLAILRINDADLTARLDGLAEKYGPQIIAPAP